MGELGALQYEKRILFAELKIFAFQENAQSTIVTTPPEYEDMEGTYLTTCVITSPDVQHTQQEAGNLKSMMNMK